MARTKIGYCRYCGNSRMIEEPEESEHELDQTEIDDIATWECECQAAKKARSKEEQRRICIDNIKGMIEEEYPDVAGILTECIPLVQEAAIDKVVFNMPDGRKISMKDSRDGIVIKKEWTTAFEVTA